MIGLALIEGGVLLRVGLGGGAALIGAKVPRGIREGLVLDASGGIVDCFILDAFNPGAILEGEVSAVGI